MKRLLLALAALLVGSVPAEAQNDAGCPYNRDARHRMQGPDRRSGRACRASRFHNPREFRMRPRQPERLDQPCNGLEPSGEFTFAIRQRRHKRHPDIHGTKCRIRPRLQYIASFQSNDSFTVIAQSPPFTVPATVNPPPRSPDIQRALRQARRSCPCARHCGLAGPRRRNGELGDVRIDAPVRSRLGGERAPLFRRR